MMGISENIARLRADIEKVCSQVGRKSSEITLVAVSKHASVEQIKEAYEAGCRDFGESRIQDALVKIPQLPSDIHWHFIGTLQSNKINKLAHHFSLIHAVDSIKLAEQLSRRCMELGRVQPILLQVNISQERSKHGFTLEELIPNVFGPIFLLKGIKIEGLMTIAPLNSDLQEAQKCFHHLRLLQEELRGIIGEDQKIPCLSMGMSNDYPAAIAEGATLLRIGSAIFIPNVIQEPA